MAHRPGTRWSDEDFKNIVVPTVRSSSSCREAEGRLGIKGSGNTIINIFRRRGLNVNDFIGRDVVPLAHRIKANSTLVDGAGNRSAQWIKTELDSADPPQHQPVPPGFTVRKTSSLLDSQGNVRAQWIGASQDEAERWDAFWKACEEQVEKYRGIVAAIPCPGSGEAELLTAYIVGDHHTGMLAWLKETGKDYDLKLSEQLLDRAVDALTARTPASDIGLLVNVGDFFHAENDNQLTPGAGHKLDVDSRASKVTAVGLRMLRRAIDRLLEKHRIVRVINIPGNHDPRLARMIALWLAAVYENEPRVEIIPNENPYMYMRHGLTLLGFAHGDGAKIDALPGIMAADRPEDWGATQYRVWLCGHVHHMSKKEYAGCSVETFRTLAPQDYWAHHKGYRSGQNMSAVTYSSEYGEVSRCVVDIRRLMVAA